MYSALSRSVTASKRAVRQREPVDWGVVPEEFEAALKFGVEPAAPETALAFGDAS
jgi:hypothetical protein